jgi:hypothetical protein
LVWGFDGGGIENIGVVKAGKLGMILEDRIRDSGTRTDMYEQVRRGDTM